MVKRIILRGGRPYLQYRDQTLGRKTRTIPLGLLADRHAESIALRPEVENLIRDIFGAGQRSPHQRPGPKPEQDRALPPADVAEAERDGLVPVTPEAAVNLELARLRELVAEGAIRESTLVQRESQFNQMLTGLGRRSWSRWRSHWYRWSILESKHQPRTQVNYNGAARRIISLRKEGHAVPDFLSEAKHVKPSAAVDDLLRESPTAREETRPYEEAEVGPMAAACAADENPFWRIVWALVTYNAFSPVDGLMLLRDKWKIRWDTPPTDEYPTAVWYEYKRWKVRMKPRWIPLAQPVVDLLLPYRKDRTAIEVPFPEIQVDWLRKLRKQCNNRHAALERRATVEHVRGHATKRPRQSFQSTLLRPIIPAGDRVVPVTSEVIVNHLMGHVYKDAGPSTNHYNYAHPADQVAAIRWYTDYVQERIRSAIGETEDGK